VLIVVFAAVFAPMLVEAARAAQNERVQRARGGIEPSGDVYEVMRVAYPAAFLIMLTEGFVRGAPSSAVVLLGAVVFVSAKLLKWWAIRALGSAWTFRVIVVPGAKLVAHGPYRFVRHPNYIGVIGELAGTALMTGAAIAGPLTGIAFLLLLLKRIAVEERATGAIFSSNHQASSSWTRRPHRG
jgi:methyltransferase